MGGAVAYALDLTPLVGALAVNLVAVIAAVVNYYLPTAGGQSVTSVNGFYPQHWVTVFLDQFYPRMDFIRRGLDMTAMVRNESINIGEISTEPEVYIDPTMPIGTVDVVDNNYNVPLREFHSQNTAISLLDIIQSAWDKTKAYLLKHQKAIYKKYTFYFLYNMSPQADSVFTPLVRATGAAFGTNNLKRVTIADIINLQARFDEADMPEEGRCLVLNPKHKADLLLEDSQAYRSFLNAPQGDMPKQIYGFDVYTSTATPRYDDITSQKIPFTAAANTTDVHSSVAWLEGEIFIADGEANVYYRDKMQDVENRKNTIGASRWFIAMPIRNRGIAAIVSFA